MSDDQPRPVWLTHERVEWIVQHLEECERCGSTGHADLGDEIKDAWLAAPADAAEAAFRALPDEHRLDKQAVTRAVLRALGFPGGPDAPKKKRKLSDQEREDVLLQLEHLRGDSGRDDA